ncbi:phorbol-12-myristate-13-acetate-induced protein 1 [Amia ocellicauda]|uniref:phorbol-12-myristate-13-acetate-induced protein 1 n=1 Tax=Amia ocellicauda TaxID=2972642 RepID=UPI0034644389
MKQELRKSINKKNESPKMSTKDQKAIMECAAHLRKIGDVFNLKYKLIDILAKHNHMTVLTKK